MKILLALACVPGAIWGQNPKPKVIPSLMEWTGGTGNYILSAASRICVDPAYAAELMDGAKAFKQDLSDALGADVEIAATAGAGPGDLLLTLNGADAALANEGYLMAVSGSVAIRANSARGVIWGTRTFLQMLRQDPGNARIPQGNIRDYPKWPIRGFLLDVGRMPIPMDYLRAYVKFMSYYKLNDLQLHLSDNTGFRLKGDAFPGLASTDVSYTKAEYAGFQKFAKTYGVQVVSEIESPAHAGYITRYRPALQHPRLSAGHLDLGNPKTFAFMDSLWDDLAPALEVVHMGTDEYSGGTAQEMVAYINHTNAYLRAMGKTPVRMWGSQGTYGGAAGVAKDILVHIWSGAYYDPLTAIKDGYEVVNTNQVWYIVPKKGAPYSDYLEVGKVYSDFQVNALDGGMTSLDEPQLKGAQWCVWNDLWDSYRYTVQDVHDRDRGPMKAFSQKMWRPDTELAFPEFARQGAILGEGPGTSDLNFIAKPKTGNWAGSRSAVASSEFSGQFPAVRLVDNSGSTRWAAKASDSEWVYVDLGKPFALDKVILYWEAAYAAQYKIQVSDDAVKWSDVRGENAGNGGVDTVAFPKVTARYVKMQGVKRATPYGYSLYEFEAYGEAIASLVQHARRVPGRDNRVSGRNRVGAYRTDGKSLKKAGAEGRYFLRQP
jgi:hexosaminidase